MNLIVTSKSHLVPQCTAVLCEETKDLDLISAEVIQINAQIKL